LGLLSPRSQREIREARKKGDDALAAARVKVKDRELGDWRDSPEGRYGSPAGADARQAVIDRAWDLLRRFSSDNVRAAMDAYMAQEGRTPQYLPEEVSNLVGGNTVTGWTLVRNTYTQTESRNIRIGLKWFENIRPMPDMNFVVYAMMYTILHELMGHWKLKDQTITVPPNLGEDNMLFSRHQESERRADAIDKPLQKDVRENVTADPDFQKEMDDAADIRETEQGRIIDAELDAWIETLNAEGGE